MRVSGKRERERERWAERQLRQKSEITEDLDEETDGGAFDEKTDRKKRMSSGVWTTER